MDRLTAEDALMLWPDRLWPQEIGALAILDGGVLFDADGRFRTEAVWQVVEARLHLVPRFRQVLHVPRRWLGPPVWADDAGFDLANHVRVGSVPAPGDEAALLGVVEQLRTSRLHRSRPLWEMWFLTGMSDRRIALFARLHHAIADGIAGVATLGIFLDAAADAPAGSMQPWTPEPLPPGRALLTDNIRRQAAGITGALRALVRLTAKAQHARDMWPAVRSMVAAAPTTRTSLDQTVGPHRALAIVRGDLGLTWQVAHQHGAKINDVLLDVTATGLGELLRGRGESVDDVALPVYVPVTLRQAQDREHARGNMVGQMVVLVPIGEPDLGSRFRQITAETARQKAINHPNLGTLFRSRLVRRVLLATLRRHPVSVTTADVPGPSHEVYFAGAPLLEVFPLVPLIGNVTIGVGALSYAGQFNICVVADHDAVPDLHIFAAAAQNELRALREASSTSS